MLGTKTIVGCEAKIGDSADLETELLYAKVDQLEAGLALGDVPSGPSARS